VNGQMSLVSIEQFFIDDGVDSRQRLSSDLPGIGVTLAGTSSANTLTLQGDGTTGADVTFGSLSLNVDQARFFGSIIFGKGGDDTITSSEGVDVVLGGAGDDTIISAGGGDILSGGTGDDTFVVASPNDVRTGSDFGETFNGGANDTSTGDTLQIGNAGTAAGQTFLMTVNISNIETLSFFTDNTTFQSFSETFTFFDQIIGNGGVSLSTFDADENGIGVTLVGVDERLNLSSVTVSEVVTNLTATTEFSTGVTIIDGNDSIGRTLTGTANNDNLSGLGGDDTFIMGGGDDVLVGGT
ncbi:uncharacterized protein METZ01_LOCUS382863, partial [marine metagenome]